MGNGGLFDRLQGELEGRDKAAGLSMALRYAFKIPQIRRQQAWNWERCKSV